MDNFLIIAAAILFVAGFGYWFYRLGKEKQIALVKEWILWACIQAEKELGSNTGQIKLRHVYDMFLERFKFLSRIITFEQFSQLVDEALDTMRKMVESNESLVDYINK